MKAINNRQTVKALLNYSKKMDDWVRPIDSTRKFHASSANAFILGVMLDRSVNAERAWDAASWMNESLGDPTDVKAVWKALVKMEKNRIEGFLRYGYGGESFHRHYKTFSKQLPKAAEIILEKYDGDPRKIWNKKRDVAEVRDLLEEIPGIGPALSRMAVLILARNYGLLGGKDALPQLDVKPDEHVMRVFQRCGFIEKKSSYQEAIDVARLLNKRFPGELDAPSFVIGRTWCRPRKPKCSVCPINTACLKILQG